MLQLFLLFLVGIQYFELVSANVQNEKYIFVHKADCLLFYTRSIRVKLNHTTLKFNDLPNDYTAKCEDKLASLKFVFNSSSDSISHVILKLDFKHTYFGWELGSLNLSVICNETNSHNCTSMKNVQLTSPVVTAHLKKSFHCMNKTFKMLKNPSIRVDFNKFQVQPFIGNVTSFGYADDCVGFFSESSLTVLFVSFILIGILSYGLRMILNIQTFDKFDNPKGKQITIAGSE